MIFSSTVGRSREKRGGCVSGKRVVIYDHEVRINYQYQLQAVTNLWQNPLFSEECHRPCFVVKSDSSYVLVTSVSTRKFLKDTLV